MSSELRVERPQQLRLTVGTKPKSRVSFIEPEPSTSRIQTDMQQARRIRLNIPRRRRSYSGSTSFSDRRHKWHNDTPNKFLLGGSISDPLNLEAIRSKNKNRKGNTLFPVKVIFPPNINDPLNLDVSEDEGGDQLADAIHRQKRRRKNRPNRKRRNSEPTTVVSDSDEEEQLSKSFDEELYKSDSAIESTKQEDFGEDKPYPRESTKQEFSEDKPFVSESTKQEQSGEDKPYPRESTKQEQSGEDKPYPSESTKQEECGEDKPYGILRQLSCPDAALAKTECTQLKSCIKKAKPNLPDKIVSPVVPPRCLERKKMDKVTQNVKEPAKYNARAQNFQYGNYLQYYGYRNPDHSIDPRLKYFKTEWIEGKDVLDIGCNIGHISLTLAREFSPRKVTGIDIDKKLINIARKNIKYYTHQRMVNTAVSDFPNSLQQLYGSLKPPIKEDGTREFPYNVKFFESNYVLEEDSLLETVKEEYDVVLALSVTKWVHLNWGDDGLKRFFRRIFNNLRSGGLFILEPQAWPSYKKKRKLTPTILQNFKNICMFPHSFEEYLTKEVGFYKIHKVAVEHHFSKGFTRPMFIFRKPSESRSSPKSFITEIKEDVPVVQNAVFSSNVEGDVLTDLVDKVKDEDVSFSKDIKENVEVESGPHVSCEEGILSRGANAQSNCDSSSDVKMCTATNTNVKSNNCTEKRCFELEHEEHVKRIKYE